MEKFKKKLEENKIEIEKEIKKLEQITDFGNDVDPDEETDESEEYGNQLGVVQVYKTRLEQINEALAKIEKGEYGICANCGKKIEMDVLELAPESQLCQECKKHE